MPARIWANEDWEVADDRLVSLGTVAYSPCTGSANYAQRWNYRSDKLR